LHKTEVGSSAFLSNVIKFKQMRYLQELEVGIVYWLKDFTAPKVFNGLYFECLLTDQKIPAHCKAKSTGIHLLKWEKEVYKPERFNLNEHKEIQKMLEDSSGS
jgi:hypothetical protein